MKILSDKIVFYVSIMLFEVIMAQILYKMLLKIGICLAVTLWRCHFIIATRPIVGDYINVCENVADYLFVRDIENCTKYFVCVNGRPESEQCRSGLYFDDAQQACVANRRVCLRCPTGRMINIPLIKTCDKYISCYYGLSFLRKCDNNKQFNRKTQKCDLTKNVDCVENRCPIYGTDKDITYMPSAASCKNYHICRAGKTKLLACVDDLYFNTKCNCCDRPENVQCSVNNLETETENVNKKKLNTNHSKLNYTSTLKGATNNVKCPPKGHFLYPYIEDLEYYFTCVEGKASLHACANGFIFDDRLKRCVSKETKEKLTSDINTDFSIINETNNCPEYGIQLMPHVNGSKYIFCVNGSATIINCPAGHYFDTTDNDCHLKLQTQLQFESNLNFSNNEYKDSIVQANYGYNLPAAEANVKCPKRGKTTLPHFRSNQYYLCIEGEATVLTCAPDMYYDSNIKSCTTPVSNSEIYTPAIGTGVSNFCPRFGTFKVSHLNKTKFYLCNDGKTFILTCAPNEIFDARINTCRQNNKLGLESENDSNMKNDEIIKPSTSIVTKIASNRICPKIGTFMFPHDEKSLYYICIDGNAITFACDNGSIFDSKLNSCQRETFSTEGSEMPKPVVLYEPVHILCPSVGAMKFPHKDNNKFYLCVNGMGSVLACAEGSFFEAEKGICHTTIKLEEEVNDTITDTTETNVTDHKSAIKCPISGTFLYPHIEKNQYYVCLEGISIVLNCTEGLIFDPNTKGCHAPVQIENAKHQPPMILNELGSVTCPVSGAHKFAHVDKTKFYLCINGMSSVFACPNGSIFVSETGICRKWQVSSEFNYKEIEMYADNAIKKSTINCPKFGTFLYPHDDKHRYFICLDGNVFDMTCAQELFFDSTINVCRKNTSEVNYNECTAAGIYKIAHVDHNKFYLCIDGIATYHSCAKGELFDAETETCRLALENTPGSINVSAIKNNTFHEDIFNAEKKNYTKSEIANNFI